MRRPAARRPRRLAGALTGLAALAACADDGPGPARAAAHEVHTVHVVEVAAQPCDRPLPARGVGLVVADGLVATAAHVVDGPRRHVTVDGRPAHVVVVDARTDLALVAADVEGSATLADRPRGDVVVRAPDGELPAELVRTGLLIVHDTSADLRHEREAHTIRPGVAQGTSGAPLVDEHGQVLGIVVLDNRTDATAYAVTSAELAAVMMTQPDPAAGVPCRE